MHVAIIGPGLIGRSIALAARQADPQIAITEIEEGQPIADARGADLIVLATPVDVILDIIRRHADVLATSVTVDTGSTKRAILAAAREAGLSTFVGGHPMAGAAVSGPGAAHADLFRDRVWFVIPAGAAMAATHRVTQFVTRLGAHPITLVDDGSEHDRVMAAVSHLPQMVASALMVVSGQATGEDFSWAGAGLYDTTRLAASGGGMWQSIATTNAAELAPLLKSLARRLDALADQLTDGHSVSELLDEARRLRALI
jgi:prephenate dehydrogenase